MNCFEIVHKQIQRRQLCEGRGSGEGGKKEGMYCELLYFYQQVIRLGQLLNLSFSERFSSLLFVLLSFSRPSPNLHIVTKLASVIRHVSILSFFVHTQFDYIFYYSDKIILFAI